MTESEKMVKRALEVARRRLGVRMKARVPSALWAGVGRCAAAVGDPVEEWVCKACRAWLQGVFDGVSYDDKTLLGTRAGSLSVWVRIPQGMVAAELRSALAAAVAWNEPRMRRSTQQPGTEGWVAGCDYVLVEG